MCVSGFGILYVVIQKGTKKMNKLVTVAAAAACMVATATAGDTRSLKEIADDMSTNLVKVAETNFNAAESALRYGIGRLRDWRRAGNSLGCSAEELAAAIADLDATMATNGWARLGVAHNAPDEADAFPKLDLLALDKSGEAKLRPVLYALSWKYRCCVNNNNNKYSAGELVELLNEYVSLGEYRYCGGVFMTIQRKSALKAAAYVRKQGKVAVGKEGAASVAELMAELVAGFNAPYLKGVNEWLEKVGVTDKRVDVSTLPTEQEAAALRDAILNGDRSVNDADLGILKFCLGVDGYNAFVRSYNGK